ncbi:MAG: hypothetical protein SGJ10_11960 [Bacteroidota bacterium]|nr:hypothetical protein [Bacteroidota bacterium]
MSLTQFKKYSTSKSPLRDSPRRIEWLKHQYIILFVSIFSIYSSSCGEGKKPMIENPKIEEPAKELSAIEPYIPQAVGMKAFQRYCLTCHSSKYIEMQPNFPEKTWKKIVDKMVKNFGAPIPDASVSIIVKYLVDVKGTRDKE